MDIREIIKEADVEKKAIGHFNISDLVALKAIIDSAQESQLPVFIGTSEGERNFIGARQAVLLVKNLRQEFGYPVFVNADHTHSFEKVQKAVAAGYDSIIVDFAKLPLEENIKETKKAVEYIRSVDPTIVIEGELGYIGSSSEVFTALPQGAAISADEMTSPEDAERFVKETGIDLLAPAVGNIHGMFEDAPSPRLDIKRISELRSSAGVPLVLHGGSGILDEDFRSAIQSGISIVHINTEIRRAWKEGMLIGLKENLDTVAPYKILDPAVHAIKKVVSLRMKLFSGQWP